MPKEKAPRDMGQRENRERKDFGPPVVQLDGVSFQAYDRTLFEGLSFVARAGETTAITGKSGTGKTAILKLISGEYLQGSGKIDINKNIRISLVPQELEDEDLDPNTTILDLYKSARGITQAEERMSALESQLANPENQMKYYDAMEEFSELGGYESEPDISKILSGLRMDERATGHVTLETRLAELSSGQLKRVLIGRGLYSNPDLLMLDDPTSHLDVASVQWLAGFLKRSKFATVVTSNNPAFIDACSSQIVGLTDSPRVFVYKGTYGEFVQKRDSQISSEVAATDNLGAKLEQLQETDNYFRSRQIYRRSADMAQVGRSLETRMNRMQKQIDEMPGSKVVFRNEKLPDLGFEEHTRGGNDVLTITSTVKRYGDFTALDLSQVRPISLHRGEKWLVWGENGSGKSTLMRIIANTDTGDFTADEGEVKIGSTIDVGYYAPDHIEVSREGKLLDEVAEVARGPYKGRSVAILRFFGFTTDAIHRQDLKTISGGERKRLALAKIMAQSPNLLLLDEPTGDYMSSDLKERLATALNDYSGTVMLISHDVEFIDYLKINRQLNMPTGEVQLRD